MPVTRKDYPAHTTEPMFAHKRSLKAKPWLQLVGLMASLVNIVPYCKLRMRPVQVHLLSFSRPNKSNMEIQVPMSQLDPKHRPTMVGN